MIKLRQLLASLFTAILLLFNQPVQISAAPALIPTPVMTKSTTGKGPVVSPAKLTPVIGYPQKADVSPALKDIHNAQAPIQSQPVSLPLRLLPKSLATKQLPATAINDTAIQSAIGPALMPSPLMNFEGVNNLNGVYPPDTNGDIGYDPATNKKYYVQWVNLSFKIWDVTGSSPTVVYGPVNGNSIWSGFGGACQATNDGDIIALYDAIAHRWLMSQFSISAPGTYGGYHQCIAISQTGDPTGAWYRYDFLVSNTKMNDYPKFGVWPDAYYMTANQFNNGSSWGGAGVFAFNRAKLLAGDPTANFVYFDLYSANSNFGGMLPAHLEGPTLPPAGAPNYFAEVDAAGEVDANTSMRLWKFHVDWTTPANSTFGLSGQPNYVVPVTPFTRLASGIPQPGTSQLLDNLGDRLMYRLVYRNYGDHESLVVNHSADAGSGRAGIRWYEVRSPGSSPVIYQQGTYAPADSLYRWMGSIAMDHSGNMALGYSVGNSSTYPSIRYTGRLAGDALGTMTQGETQIIAGSGSQTGSAHRWGDYSSLSIDPSDDCTFWYTTEYIQTTGATTWQTRVASFKFPSCNLGQQGTLTGAISATGSGAPIAGALVNGSSTTSQTVSTVSGANGVYTMPAPVGTYTVTASAYGYQAASISGISVVSGTTTTANLQLTVSARYVVSGFVTDATTHWPLYAQINIQGTPVSPPPPGNSLWTDPVSGYYSVTLAASNTYTFVFNAYVGGYQPATLSVGPLNADRTLNAGLSADAKLCIAPGYQGLAITETFDSATPPVLPGGWATTTVAPIVTPANWATNVGTNYPSGNNAHSLPNLVYFNSYMAPSGSSTRLYHTNPINMKTLSSSILTFWMFHDQGYPSSPDRVQVQVSTDGSTWINVGAPITRTTTPVGWQQHSVSLSAYASSTSLRIGLLGISAYGNDVHLDDINLGGACLPQSGGLVVGNVYDANTGAPLPGASVTNDSGNSTTAVTLVNPAMPGAFYTLFSPAGTHVFSASQTLYGVGTASPTVVVSNTIRQDIYVPAAKLALAPPGLQITLSLGAGGVLSAQINNTGAVSAPFRLYRIRSGSVVTGVLQHPESVVEPADQNEQDTLDLELDPAPPTQPLAAGGVIRTFTPTVTGAWGVAMDAADNTVWVSSPSPAWGGVDRMVEYSVYGSSTGRSYPYTMPHQFGPADMTDNPNTGMLWVMGVGSGPDNCIYEMDPASGATGNSICPNGGFAASQRGLAYDPVNDTYFAGSWNDSMIHHFDANGVLLDEVNVGLAISGLAYNPDTHHLFAMLNISPTAVYVLDAANNYAVLGSFSISAFGPNEGAGLEMSCDGNLWAVDQAKNQVLLVNSGETTTMCQTNQVPWLATTPVTGTVPAYGSQSISVAFSAAQPVITQTGVYTALLKLWHKTPYSVAAIPVTMTAQINYTLVGSVIGSGSILKQPARASYDYGDVVTLTAVPSAGWSFGIWSGAASGVLTQTTVTITGNTAVTATFTQNNYTLSVGVVGNGNVISQPAQSTYHYGDVVTLTATPATGWSLAAWSGGATGAAVQTTVTITVNTVVTATFTQVNYTLKVGVSPVGGGSVVSQPVQSSYHYSDVVTLTATANTGWSFAAWSGGAAGASPQTTVTLTGNAIVTATFTQNNYFVVGNVVGNGNVSQQPAQASYHYGDVVTLTATPSAGWSFSGWSGAASGILTQTTVTITGDAVVTATFTQNNYSLRVGVIGSGSVVSQPAQSTYHYGDVVTLTATANTGWSFASWSGGATGALAQTTVTLTGNTIVTATFTQDNYLLRVGVIGSGSVVSQPAQSTYHYSDVVTLTAAANTGWTFAGWSGGASGVLTQTTVTMTGSTVVTATFTQNNYTLGVNTIGSGSVVSQPAQSTYHYGEMVTLTAIANTGWTLANWTGASCSLSNPCVITIQGNTSVTATFTQLTYTLSVGVSPVGSGSVVSQPAQSTYHYGETATLTATANTGWTFANWTGATCSLSNPCVITIQGNTSVTATFTQLTYTLSVGVSPVGSGNVVSQPARSTYHYGDTVTLTATANAGWTFANWTGATCSVTNPCVLTIQGNTAVTATFTQNNYSLNVGVIGSGSVVSQPAQSTYHYGDAVTLTATPNAGWAFANWSGGATGILTQTTLTITGNTIITATFTQITYTLSVGVSPVGGGGVISQPAQATYHYGDAVTLTATPNAGWVFATWSGNASGVLTQTMLVITGNLAVTATFTQLSYTLTINTVGSGSVDVLPNQALFLSASQVTLTAIPNTGWVFASWSGDAQGASAETSLVMNDNRMVTATFVSPYTVTVSPNPDIIVANGISSTVISVTVVDENGAPLPSVPLVLTTTAGSLGSLSGVTDLSGTYTTLLTSSTLSQTAIVTATTGVRSSGAQVSFISLDNPASVLTGTYTANTGTVTLGQTLTFTLKATNTGQSTAQGVWLSATVPANTVITGAIQGGGLAGGVITWTGSLAPGETHTLRFEVMLDASAPLAAAISSTTTGAVQGQLDFELPLTVTVSVRQTYLPLALR